MRQSVIIWPLEEEVSRGCVCVWWGEGRGNVGCHVSGLIMALPPQSSQPVRSCITLTEVRKQQN